jgi:hypothetical protein
VLKPPQDLTLNPEEEGGGSKEEEEVTSEPKARIYKRLPDSDEISGHGEFFDPLFSSISHA